MMGPGMMGPGYGPGYGMGPGMMGPGMMGGYGGWAGPPLNDKQREQLAKIQVETFKKQWDLMGKMQGEQFRLRELYAAGKADEATVEKSYKRMGELRTQMYNNMVEARKQMDGVPTPEQRNAMRRGGYGWGW